MVSLSFNLFSTASCSNSEAFLRTEKDFLAKGKADWFNDPYALHEILENPDCRSYVKDTLGRDRVERLARGTLLSFDFNAANPRTFREAFGVVQAARATFDDPNALADVDARLWQEANEQLHMRESDILDLLKLDKKKEPFTLGDLYWRSQQLMDMKELADIAGIPLTFPPQLVDDVKALLDRALPSEEQKITNEQYLKPGSNSVFITLEGLRTITRIRDSVGITPVHDQRAKAIAKSVANTVLDKAEALASNRSTTSSSEFLMLIAHDLEDIGGITLEPSRVSKIHQLIGKTKAHVEPAPPQQSSIMRSFA